MSCVAGVLFRVVGLCLRLQDSCLFCPVDCVSVLMFRSVIHFDFNLVHLRDRGLGSIFRMWIGSFSSTIFKFYFLKRLR